MSEEELAAIRARADLASVGPWEANGEYVSGPRYPIRAPCVRLRPSERNERDAEFIAQARQDIPALLGEVALLRASLVDIERDVAAIDATGDTLSRKVKLDALERIAQALGRRSANQQHTPERA